MRALRGFTVMALLLASVGTGPAPTAGQTLGPRSLALPVEQVIPTRIEVLLATPNVVLVADYYRIDMRFGPSMRIDAVVVETIEPRTRLKGVRVQVRDNENRSRQEGTSFIDVDELPRLSRGLASMSDLAAKWTQDDRQATEVGLTTTGGFRVAIRETARIPRVFLSTGLIDPVVTSIELGELPTVKHAFDQALAILTSK